MSKNWPTVFCYRLRVILIDLVYILNVQCLYLVYSDVPEVFKSLFNALLLILAVEIGHDHRFILIVKLRLSGARWGWCDLNLLLLIQICLMWSRAIIENDVTVGLLCIRIFVLYALWVLESKSFLLRLFTDSLWNIGTLSLFFHMVICILKRRFGWIFHSLWHTEFILAWKYNRRGSLRYIFHKEWIGLILISAKTVKRTCSSGFSLLNERLRLLLLSVIFDNETTFWAGQDFGWLILRLENRIGCQIGRGGLNWLAKWLRLLDYHWLFDSI